MTESDAFIAAVLASPSGPCRPFGDWLEEHGLWSWEHLLALVNQHRGADAFRLLAADWCDANGRPERAEFIRVQCELARAGGMMPAPRFDAAGRELDLPGSALRRRERELLAGHCRNWSFGPATVLWHNDDGTCIIHLPVDARPTVSSCECRSRRGFFAQITCTAEDWLRHADALTAATPLEEVTLTTWPGREEELPHHGTSLRYWRLPAEWSLGRREGEVIFVHERERRVRRSLKSCWRRIKFTLPPVTASLPDND